MLHSARGGCGDASTGYAHPYLPLWPLRAGCADRRTPQERFSRPAGRAILPILTRLLQQPGELVSREELQQQLWGDGTSRRLRSRSKRGRRGPSAGAWRFRGTTLVHRDSAPQRVSLHVIRGACGIPARHNRPLAPARINGSTIAPCFSFPCGNVADCRGRRPHWGIFLGRSARS